MRQENEAAATQVYGFIVAGLVFFAAFGALLWTVQVGPDEAPPKHAEQELDAASVAAILLGDEGAGWATPDTLARFGLAGASGSGLEADHLLLLNDATLGSQPNGLLEYDEARAALGMGDPAGFRLSVIPIDLDAALRQHDFSHIKALYIGDFTSLSTITLSIPDATIVQANARLNLSMGSNTGLERTVVDSIGVDFDNEMHLTTTTPSILVQVTTVPPVSVPLLTYLGVPVWDGDVLYDNKQYLDLVLPSKLAFGGYDLLILGSGIDHSTLTANSVKNSIDAFVRGGGTLMVFGSPGGNFNWMQPILDVSATSVSGPVTPADADHPILTLPWELDWDAYPTNNLGWTLGQPSTFQNVLVQGGKPVVAISNDGAIGSGNVFLSSIQPRAVAALLGPDEAAHFMFNMLLYDSDPVGDPTVRFGPDPPGGVPVSSAVRTTWVDDGETQIPVRIELLVWGT